MVDIEEPLGEVVKDEVWACTWARMWEKPAKGTKYASLMQGMTLLAEGHVVLMRILENYFMLATAYQPVR